MRAILGLSHTQYRATRLHPARQGTWSRESRACQRPGQKVRRWVVEVAHNWFNRFRKLLVRYEKLERSFLALHHSAAAMIVFRKVPQTVNIIYG